MLKKKKKRKERAIQIEPLLNTNPFITGTSEDRTHLQHEQLAQGMGVDGGGWEGGEDTDRSPTLGTQSSLCQQTNKELKGRRRWAF